MEIRTLEYFLMVAREENITRAAQKLYITQPTLSRQLAKLEEELGVSLFKRGQYSISLTEEGELLKKRAQIIVELANTTKMEFQHEDFELSGEISIGCAECMNVHELSKWIKEFQKVYPKVVFDIHSGVADEMIEKMDKGLLDMALILKRLDYSNYMYISMPLRDTFKLLIPETHPLNNKQIIIPEDLKGQDFLIQKNPGANNIVSSWLGKYRDEVHITGQYDLMNNLATMIQEGMGVAITLDFGVQYKDLVYKQLQPPMDIGSVLLYRKQEISKVVSTFIDFIRNTKVNN